MAACSPVQARTEPAQAYQTATNGDYQVMSRPEAATVKAGEPVIADFIVKNIGQKELDYYCWSR